MIVVVIAAEQKHKKKVMEDKSSSSSSSRNRKEEEIEILKRRISSHPLYGLLLENHMDCLKVSSLFLFLSIFLCINGIWDFFKKFWI